MILTNNFTAANNHTDHTGMLGMTDSDFMDFLRRLRLWEKIILVFVSIFTILGNSVVMIVTWREKNLHQPNKYFIACLAVTDLLVGILVAPLKVYDFNVHRYSRSMMSIHLCRFMQWIDIFAFTTSVYTLTFISFDRYLKISKPLRYRSRMTSSRSRIIIFIIVLLSISLATYSATPDSGSHGVVGTGSGPCSSNAYSEKVKVFFVFLSISNFFLPTIFILTMYALIFLVAHKRNKMLLNGELSQGNNDQNHQTVLRQDMKVIRMLLVVVGVFIFCWAPMFVWRLLLFCNSNLLSGHSLSRMYAMSITGRITLTLPILNSLCNPVIYACFDQTYKEAFKQLFRRIMRRNDARREQRQIAIELRSPRIA